MLKVTLTNGITVSARDLDSLAWVPEAAPAPKPALSLVPAEQDRRARRRAKKAAWRAQKKAARQLLKSASLIKQVLAGPRFDTWDRATHPRVWRPDRVEWKEAA